MRSQPPQYKIPRSAPAHQDLFSPQKLLSNHTLGANLSLYRLGDGTVLRHIFTIETIVYTHELLVIHLVLTV